MHQIRREKRTTVSEVIVRGKRNIKQDRYGFISNFLLKAPVEIRNSIFKKKKSRSRMALLFNNYFLIKYKILLTTEKKTCVFIG